MAHDLLTPRVLRAISTLAMSAILAGRRIGLAVLCSFGVLVLTPTAGQGRCDMSIRVLLDRSSGGIEVVVEGRKHSISASRGGIRVDGGKLRQRWESGPVGSARVGELRTAGRLVSFLEGSDVVVVNEVPLEMYVAGAVSGEMPANWAQAALRAQAVVSRSYALNRRGLRRALSWDVEAGTRSQVYRGLDVAEPAARATRETRCRVLTYAGVPILAAFHSASGGRTASAGEVWGRDIAYLISMDVPGEDDSPDTYWRAAISRPTLGLALRAAGYRIGDVTEATVEDRTESGRVRWIRFKSGRGEVRLSGRQLRQILGESTLRSTLFQLGPPGEDLVFVGSGRGHGVGMSQWAARSLAEQGATYQEILDKFYPGATLGVMDGAQTAAMRRESP